MSETTTLWASREDGNATLCTPCGLEELNSTVAVILGILPPFESVEGANQWYEENYGEDSEEARAFTPDDPAFVKTTEGKCLNCGASNEDSNDADVA